MPDDLASNSLLFCCQLLADNISATGLQLSNRFLKRLHTVRRAKSRDRTCGTVYDTVYIATQFNKIIPARLNRKLAFNRRCGRNKRPTGLQNMITCLNCNPSKSLVWQYGYFYLIYRNPCIIGIRRHKFSIDNQGGCIFTWSGYFIHRELHSILWRCSTA